MKARLALFAALLVLAGGAGAQGRDFSSLFPDIGGETRAAVFSAGGVTRTRERSSRLEFLPPALAGLGFAELVREKKPVVLVESLLVIPGEDPVSLADIYNALGGIRDLKGRVYHSHTRNSYVALFQDATRIADPRRSQPVPDPAPAGEAPPRDTVYMNLRDVNFGPSYYRADFTALGRGALYDLGNFRTIYYFVVPVIRENRFFARFYIEPLAEGVLVYCIAGADVSDFVSGRIDIPSAIEKRLLVIQDWVTDGIRRNTPSGPLR